MKSSIMLHLSLLGLLVIMSNFLFINSDETEFAIEPEDLFDKETAIKDKDEVDFDDTITGDILVDEMGLGWNLGNTLDAFDYTVKVSNDGLDSETMWGNPETNEEMIQELIIKYTLSVLIRREGRYHHQAHQIQETLLSR